MSEWQTFTGSQEQFLALSEAGHDVLVRGMSWSAPVDDLNELMACFSIYDTKEFLICNPHPLADMICQQARTGQEVFVHIAGTIYANYIAHRAAQDMDYFHSYYNKKLEATTYITKKPNWHIPGAQYSFTRIGGYRANK